MKNIVNCIIPHLPNTTIDDPGVNEVFKQWVMDEDNYGAELGEVFDRIRVSNFNVQSKNLTSEQKKERDHNKLVLGQEMAEIMRKALPKHLEQMKESLSYTTRRKPDSFFDVMADAISNNVSTAIKKLGFFRGIYYGYKMNHQQE
ncbi:MAG: hypothetical protein IJ040_07760 [Lachnospiraceae bacterium]|nr:hypothetical protein [Lachnospiraceae bacterium]